MSLSLILFALLGFVLIGIGARNAFGGRGGAGLGWVVMILGVLPLAAVAVDVAGVFPVGEVLEDAWGF